MLQGFIPVKVLDYLLIICYVKVNDKQVCASKMPIWNCKLYKL